MAELNQNIVIYDLDKFKVRFTVTDAESSLISAGLEAAWWGIATSPNSSAEGVKIQKTSGSWNGVINDYEGITIYSSYLDIEVPLNSGSSGGYQSGSINISLNGTYTNDAIYYHELVYSGINNINNSNVIAVGTVTVKPSMFTKKGYRK